MQNMASSLTSEVILKKQHSSRRSQLPSLGHIISTQNTGGQQSTREQQVNDLVPLDDPEHHADMIIDQILESNQSDEQTKNQNSNLVRDEEVKGDQDFNPFKTQEFKKVLDKQDSKTTEKGCGPVDSDEDGEKQIDLNISGDT